MPDPAPNPALQLTASRARSLVFETLFLARSRQLNANPFGTRGNVIVISFSFWIG